MLTKHMCHGILKLTRKKTTSMPLVFCSHGLEPAAISTPREKSSSFSEQSSPMVVAFLIPLSETKISLELLCIKMKCYLKYSAIKDFLKAPRPVPKLR